MLYEASELGRTYLRGGVTVRALDGVDLKIGQGEFVAISGPSGSGKTTLLNALGLLDPDYEGELRLDGRDVRGLSSAARARLRLGEIGFVFQAFNLLDALSVRDNVALPRWRLEGDLQVARRRAEGLLVRLGLEHRLDHGAAELSAGEMQRTAVARALINEPRVVLADEPTGNLDAENAAFIMEALADILDNGKTLIIISHDAEVVSSAHRVIRLRHGRAAGEADADA